MRTCYNGLKLLKQGTERMEGREQEHGRCRLGAVAYDLYSG